MAKDLLDLHGKTEDEVFDLVEKFINASEKRGAKQVRIMTGKGKGIVQKRTLEYLKLGHYPWKFEKTGDKTNEGVLVVFL